MRILKDLANPVFCFLSVALIIISAPGQGLCGTFSDDFEDGALGSWWYVYDGSVTDADEYGGALHLQGHDGAETEKWGDVIFYGQAEYLTGDVTLTATFEAKNPGEYTLYGIYLGKTDIDEFHDATIIAVWHDPIDGTMISFDDEDVYSAANGYRDPEAQSVIIGDISAYSTVTLELHKTGDVVTGWYKLDSGSFNQIGIYSNDMTDPFAVSAFGNEWPPTVVGTNSYDFCLTDFQITGSVVPDMLAGGGPDTFTDDFNNSDTYLDHPPPLYDVPPTKWRHVGVASGNILGEELPGGIPYAVRLVDNNPEFHAPAMGADFAQYFDLSSVVLEAEVRPDPSTEFGEYSGSGGIGLGVYDDTGENICGGIGAGFWYDRVWSEWWFYLFDINEYEPWAKPIDPVGFIKVNIDPTEFHKIRMERVNDRVSATLDREWTLEGTPNLPIDLAGIGVWAQNLADGLPANYSFDNFSMNAQPDDRHVVFQDVEILEDTCMDESFPTWSRDNRKVAYKRRDETYPGSRNVCVKRIDSAESAMVCTGPEDNVWVLGVPAFSPDYNYVFFTARKPDTDLTLQIKRAPADPDVIGEVEPIQAEDGVNWRVYDVNPSCNLLLGTREPHGGIPNLFVVPINEYEYPLWGTNDDGVWGTDDDNVTFLTNFQPPDPGAYIAHFDATCERVVFMSITLSPTAPAQSDIYVLSGVQGMLKPDDPDDPPTSYDSDPLDRIDRITTSPNFEITGGFSRDGSLVYYCEDVNGTFYLEKVVYYPWLPWLDLMNESHWEIFAVNPDAPEERIKLNYYRPYSQGLLTASPDGTMLAFLSDNRDDCDDCDGDGVCDEVGVVDSDIYIVTLKVQDRVNAQQGLTITDGSGTALVFNGDTGQGGSLTENTIVSIQTPLPGDIPSPETLPGGLQNIALARVIEAKSPTAEINELNPPILTIHYTDEEVSGLDEMSLRIYVYNDETEPPSWEPIPSEPTDCDGCGPDPVANTVTGTLTHVSTFCVSGASLSDDFDEDSYTEEQGDCDDADASIHPGAQEIPYDGIDQDCDGSDLTDVDGDGFNATDVGGDDCDDDDPSVNPGVTEVPYNGKDDDCDPSTPDDDLDSDTYPTATDCDDDDASINPGAQEIPYDGIDQDCDGSDLTDVDDDGYDAIVAGGDDCDDNEAAVNPGATEVCDAVDNDCDGEIDEGVLITFYQDADGDSYGNAAVTIEACEAPEGYVADATDCDDTNGMVNPGMAEQHCNGIDDDCDAATPDDVTPPAITCPGNIDVNLQCGGTPVTDSSIQAFLNDASAVDDCDGGVDVTNEPPPTFYPGITTVTFEASDTSGHTSSCQASVHVKYQYSGVLQPINADGSSIFKAGRTIPVKFRVYCSGATVVETATATLSVFKIADVITGTVEEVDPEAAGESNTGNLFRFDSEEQLYIYNWSTKGLSAGTYRIRISLDDATMHEAELSLRGK